MAEIGTPSGPLPGRDGNYTRTPEPESPSQSNMRSFKRQQRAINTQAPPRLVLSEDPATRNTAENFSTSTDPGITGLISQHLNIIQKATDARNNIIKAVTRAIDTCIRSFKSPEEAKTTIQLQQHLLSALKEFLQLPENTSSLRNDTSSGKTAPKYHSWRKWLAPQRTLAPKT